MCSTVPSFYLCMYIKIQKFCTRPLGCLAGSITVILCSYLTNIECQKNKDEPDEEVARVYNVEKVITSSNKLLELEMLVKKIYC